MDGLKVTYPAPAALIEHCTRRAPSTTSSAGIGTTDPAAIRQLIEWLTEHDAFDDYSDWLAAGMVCRLELGDAGLDVWAITHNDTVTPDVIASKWNSFAVDATTTSADDLQKIGTLFAKAKKMGCPVLPRASASWMFRGITQTDVFGKPVQLNPAPVPSTQETVAALAAQAGASLPPPNGSIPLTEAQRIVAALGQPILDEFLAGTSTTSSFPHSREYPELPENCASHPLYEAMNEAIQRMMAMVECAPKQFRQGRVLPALAVLHSIHPDICDRLFQRLVATGAVISPGQFDSAVKTFENKVRREVNTGAGFVLDKKGTDPDPSNSDNVAVFARMNGKRFRQNIWADVAEYADADKENWQLLSDTAMDDLLVRAEDSQYNYHPSKERFRRGLGNIARETPFDPVLARIDAAAAAWDGVPRLDSWLSLATGVPNDAYHRAVGLNIVGGMIRRARHPGCKHDECALLISPGQGKGKSTLTEILAMDTKWHTRTLKLGGRQQDMIPQLAGKWVVELQELAGMGKTEIEDVKAFISTQEDNYTKKYEVTASDHQRRCIFIGTTNNKRPLQDETGNRRFLPVHIPDRVNEDWLRTNVEQIIGEAAIRESNGETFKIPQDLWGVAEEHQESARHISPIEELIGEWFDRPSGASYYITVADINNALKLANIKARYASHMDKLGWRYETLDVEGRRCRLWLRHHSNNLKECVRLMPIQTQPNRPVEMRLVSAVVGVPVGLPPSPSGLPPLPY